MWFKVLVSVACAAVITLVATVFWDRYSEAKSRQEAEDARLALIVACTNATGAYGQGRLTVDQANQLRECKRQGVRTGLEDLFPDVK